MKIYICIENLIKKILNHLWILFIKIHEIKNIIKKRKIYRNVKLSKEQKMKIDDFYIKNYGKKIPYYWHRLYTSYTGKFDYKYVPEYIFSTQIETKTIKKNETNVIENKNMLSVLFQDNNIKKFKTPKSYIMCIAGKYFDENRNLITRSKALELSKKLNGGFVIKKSVDTSSGRDVYVLYLEKGIDKYTNKNIEYYFNLLGDNFSLQEKIIPHKDFAKLYDKSINTLRVITYILNNQIYVAPIAMRIGQGEGRVDNAHAGGMFIGVSNDGKLLEEAFTEYQKKYKVHPNSGITFKNYQLPNIDLVKECAIKMHKKIPMVDYVSWDFTVDKDENAVLIEVNLCSQSIWFPQMAHGKGIFEENTAQILKALRK